MLVHGIGEHAGRYSQWIEMFREENYSFLSLDLPGHGRSEGKRGKIRSFVVIHEVIDILIKISRNTFPGIPLYLYGHSMGGGMVLEYVLRFNPMIKAVIATSPWLKLSFEPPAIKAVAAMLASKVIPGFVQASGLNTGYLSHDASVIEVYKSDPLVHDKISVGLFAAATNAAKFSLANASKLKIPALILHGSDDMICSPEGSRNFASGTPRAELKIWDGGYHELHNEPFRKEVFSYIINWIKKA
jgi:alpha-beta hydrolase superfamily lysophospholipase